MEGKRFKPSSNFGCGTRLVDRISELPDEIIGEILSLLSLREAARTSVLCSRWPDLWKHTPNLDFTTDMLKPDLDISSQIRMVSGRLWNAERCKYVQLVNSVIRSHKAPSLKRFTISLCVNKSATRIAAKWLEFAFSRGVERLELDFKCSERMVFLEELLTKSGLCERSPILFKSLKALCIKHVRVGGEAVKIFLSNCPLLEELIIAHSYLTSDVEVCGSNLLLKRLDLWHTSGQGKSLIVSAPNLTRLKLSVINRGLFLESLPKLVELKGRNMSARDLFRFSSQLEILEFSLKNRKKFLRKKFPEMPKLRKLVVQYEGVKTDSLLPITAPLWASPRLEEFKLVFSEKRNKRGGIAFAPIMQGRRNGERCPHLHLKLFELTGFSNGAVGLVKLATYISDNCVGLEKINIFLGDSDETHYKQAARN